MQQIVSFITRQALPVFCALTLVLSFAVFQLPIPGEAVPVVMVGIPALVALSLTAITDRWSGVRALVSRFGQWRVRVRWIAAALGLTFVLRLSMSLIALERQLWLLAAVYVAMALLLATRLHRSHTLVTRRTWSMIGILAMLWPATQVVRAGESSAAPAIQSQQSAPFTWADCPIAPIEGVTIDCGYLTVAESRRNVESPYIRLAVAVLRSPNPDKAPDPVLFLAGGPGEAALAIAPDIFLGAQSILAKRDIILLDQRGTGYSRPRLDCSFGQTTTGGDVPMGALQAAGERPAVLQQQVDVLSACGEQYRRAGIDLAAYNSIENAADLEDLRRALGYGQWNLYGNSYGTRLGLTAMQYRPDTIRSAVLDSLSPPQVSNFPDTFASFSRSLELLFAGCAAEPACNDAYPDLASTYDSLIPRLNIAPAQVAILDPQTGDVLRYQPVSGVDLASLVFSLAYRTPTIPLVPALIGETARGNYELLSAIVGQALIANQTLLLYFSPGMQVAVQCNEELPFVSPLDFVRARHTYPRAAPLAHDVFLNEAILEVCAAWGLTSVDPSNNLPISSDVPALLISGSNDPALPPANASAAQATLPNSMLVEYPRGGHTPGLTSPCLGRMIATFLDDPAQKPDQGCLAAEPPAPFIVP